MRDLQGYASVARFTISPYRHQNPERICSGKLIFFDGFCNDLSLMHKLLITKSRASPGYGVHIAL